tara:strand:+ start:404 stop:643 length:240 start_codon:yes stop_codon:yes gene_type:complete
LFISKSVTKAILLNPAEVITAITSTTLPYDKISSALIKIFLSFLFFEIEINLGTNLSIVISVSCTKIFSSLLIVIDNGV